MLRAAPLDEAGRAVERTRQLRGAECARSLDQAAPRLRQDLVVAMLTDHLTDGPWSEWVSAGDLRELAAGLPERVRKLIDSSPAARTAFWGIQIVDLATGKTLYELNPDHFFRLRRFRGGGV